MACDSFTKLMMHCDGVGSAFIDSSPSVLTLTANGSATQSSTQVKFGTASFDITAGSVTTPNTTLQPGTGDFTIDWWHYFNDTTTVAPIWTDGFTVGYECDYVSGALQVYITGVLTFNQLYSPSVAWHHLAVVRTGTTLLVFADGTELGTLLSNNSNIGGNVDFTVGDINRSPDQYIDEFRVSIGIARWTANFTPPTAPYCASSSNFLSRMMLMGAG